MIVGEAWSWPKRASQGADQEPGPGLFKSEPRGLMFAAECLIILDGKPILEEYGPRNDPQPEGFPQALEMLSGRTLDTMYKPQPSEI